MPTCDQFVECGGYWERRGEGKRRMGNAQSSRDNGLAEHIKVPIRILPSRGMHLMKAVVLISAAGLSLLAWAAAVSLRHPVAPSEAGQVALLFGGLLAVVAVLIVRQQVKYFGSESRYALLIEPRHVTLITPTGRSTYSWHDLTPFAVDEDLRDTMDEEKHVHRRLIASVVAHDTGPEARTLRIKADDFASKLPGNGRERAGRLCAILNDVRQWAKDASLPRDAMPARAFGGLVVRSATRTTER